MSARTITVLGVQHTAPAFDVPARACDCHVHVFGPSDRFPYSTDRVYTPGPASVDDLLALQRALGLHRVVIVQPSPYGTDNSCLLDALRRLGERARGVAVIDGATPDAALRRMHEAGVRGVRVNLETRGQRDPAAAGELLDCAASRAARFNWHVQVYAGLSVLASLHDMILTLPVPVVVDHFGKPTAAAGTAEPGFAALHSLLRRGEIYVKLSAPYRISEQADYGDAAKFARALIEAHPDRVVWGRDWPHTGTDLAHPGGGRPRVPRDPGDIEPFRPEDDGLALRRLRLWAADAALLRKILVDTPARLYGF
jgi:predicted TIM-barrel fold metal-dependent hydrolase